MSFGETIAAFLGRLIFSWFFLSQAYHYVRDWTGTVALLALKNVPEPSVTLSLALLAMLLGSLSLFLGFRARLGALALFGFTVAATATLHDYWHVQDLVSRQIDYNLFSRDVAIAAGLLVLVGVGPGKFALDREAS
jgi:putative oxidoreductase